MSADRWAELERLAKAATPGHWMTVEGANSHVFDLRVTAVGDEYRCVAFSDDEDAAFIAAANPATVLELIAAARQQSPENKEPGT